MSAEPSLRVDGVWLGGSGLPYSDLAWTDRADGGNFEATFALAQEYGSRPAPLFQGAKVEIFLGPVRRWYGLLNVTDWDSGAFTASGMSQRAYDFAARTVAGVSTSVANTGIDTSVAFDGWPVVNGSVSTIANEVDPPENFSTVGAVCDLAAQRAGLRWGVWGDGVVKSYAAPTVYDYLLAPGVLELGETSEDRFSGVLFSYLDPGGVRRYDGAGDATYGHTIQDFTNLGPVATSTAVAIAANLLALGNASPGWTNGVDVTSAQLLTPGGLPADLASVTAGQMVRASVVDGLGLGYRDLVIGETKYAAGSDVLSMSPVGKVASNLSEVIEETYTRITGLPVAS